MKAAGCGAWGFVPVWSGTSQWKEVNSSMPQLLGKGQLKLGRAGFWDGVGVRRWGRMGKDKSGELCRGTSQCMCGSWACAAVSIVPSPSSEPQCNLTSVDLWNLSRPAFNQSQPPITMKVKPLCPRMVLYTLNSSPHLNPTTSYSDKCHHCPFIDELPETQRQPSFLE